MTPDPQTWPRAEAEVRCQYRPVSGQQIAAAQPPAAVDEPVDARTAPARGVDVAGGFVLLGAVFAWNGFHDPAYTTAFGLVGIAAALVMVSAGIGRVRRPYAWPAGMVASLVVIVMVLLEVRATPDDWSQWPTEGSALSLTGAIGGLAIAGMVGLRALSTARPDGRRSDLRIQWPSRLTWAILLWLLFAVVAWVLLSPVVDPAGCDRDCAFFEGLTLFWTAVMWVAGSVVLAVAWVSHKAYQRSLRARLR